MLPTEWSLLRAYIVGENSRARGQIGWGIFLDANAKLEEIDPEQRDRSDVLALRIRSTWVSRSGS